MKLSETMGANSIIIEDTEEQTLIVGGSGKGKTLLAERMIQTYYDKGFHIIVATDQKDLIELGFMQFPVILGDYHKKGLDFEGQEPRHLPVKLYHPFTFNIPDNQIPETEFYTLPIKAMGDAEFNLLLETDEDRTTRELLMQARDELKPDEGLWHFMKRVERLTERLTKKKGSKEIKLPDKNRFMLKGVSSGDVKNLDTIERSFHRFQKHLFLTPQQHPLNLDWKSVFENQRQVKIFTTRYISRDKKAKDFSILMLLNQLVEHAHLSKQKILVVLDEIKDLCPRDNTSYNKVLASQIAKHLNTSFRARGIGSLSTSQSFAGISKKLIRENVWNVTLIMYTDSEADLKLLREVYGLGSDEIGILLNLGRNQFIVRGIPDLDVRDYQASHQGLLPAFCHAEPKYQFDKLFKQHFPSQMHQYKELKEKEQKQVREWIAFFLQQSKEELAQEQAQQDELEKAKSKAEQLEQALEQQKTQKTQEVADKKSERDAEIIQRYKEGASQSSLARDYGLSQPGIRKILVKEGVLQ